MVITIHTTKLKQIGQKSQTILSNVIPHRDKNTFLKFQQLFKAAICGLEKIICELKESITCRDFL